MPKTIEIDATDAWTRMRIGVHLKWIALKKRGELASEVVAAVRVPTPCTPR